MKSLSIIIPAYNEASRIGATLKSLIPYLIDQQMRGRDVELIIVDNRSTDDTADIAQQSLFSAPFRWVILREEKPGKGYAVQHGVLAAKHDIVAFMDADLMVPLTQIDPILGAIDTGALISIASRYASGSTPDLAPPLSRRILSLLSQAAIRSALRIPVRDTQCGLKAFDRAVVPLLFSHLTSGGWGFDVEILSRAVDRGMTIIEVPVHWSYQPGSHMSFMGALKSGRDLLTLIGRRKVNHGART